MVRVQVMPNGSSTNCVICDDRQTTVAKPTLPLPWQVAKTRLRLNNFSTSASIREPTASNRRVALLDVPILTLSYLSGIALHQDATQVTLPGCNCLSTAAHRSRGSGAYVSPPLLVARALETQSPLVLRFTPCLWAEVAEAELAALGIQFGETREAALPRFDWASVLKRLLPARKLSSSTYLRGRAKAWM